MSGICFETHTQLATPQANTSDILLMDRVLTHGPQALIWQGTQGIVVPRTYGRNPHFEATQHALASAGWPIEVRQSGGGVVPQGPGVWNLSLSWRQYGKPFDLAQAAYPFICRILQQALERCGIPSSPQAVDGSFCDGRFNLAIGNDPYQKIVGTAQVWRLAPPPLRFADQPRQPGDPTGWHVGLVHAVILMDINEKALTLKTNLVEQLLHQPRRYQADKICSLARLGLGPTDFLQALQQVLSQLSPPHDQGWP